MYYLILLGQLIASGTHIISKDLATRANPSSILFYRALIASIFFLIITKLFNSAKKIEKEDYKYFIILAILNIPINQFLFLVSIKFTTAPNVALAYALTPIFVYILAYFFLKESSSVLKIVGIGIAVGGTILLLTEKGIKLDSIGLVGDLLAILAALAWALYTLIGRKITQKYGSIFSTAIAMQLGFAIYAIIYIFLPAKDNPLNYSMFDWAEILYLGIITSGLSYILWYMALKRIEASKVSVFNNLQPILTTILAVIFLGQQISTIFVLGGIAVIFGVYLTQKK